MNRRSAGRWGPEKARRLRKGALSLAPRRSAAALLAVLASCAHGAARAPATLTQAGAPTGQVFPAADWVRVASPQALGWSSQKLAIARAFSEGLGSDSVMIVQGGVVVDAWGDPARKLWTTSMRKSLLSALIGRAVAAQTIQLDETLGQLGRMMTPIADDRHEKRKPAHWNESAELPP
jgi:hypothetical protein